MMENIMNLMYICLLLHQTFSIKISDWASKNGPCGHKIPVIIKNFYILGSVQNNYTL